MKVYCFDCIHYIEGDKVPFPFGPPDHIKERCGSPYNFKENHKSYSHEPISTPRIINRYNNCKWYETESSSSSSGDYEPSSSSSSL